MRRWSAKGSSCRISRKLFDSRTLRKILSCAGLDSRPRRDHILMFRRRRQVTQETAALDPPPRRPFSGPGSCCCWHSSSPGSRPHLLSRDDGSAAEKPRVPAVVGLSTAAATEKLAQRGYAAIVRGRVSSGARLGTVLSQSPAPGTELDRGGQVTIVAARGPSTVAVPNVVGLSVDQAVVRLRSAGLNARTVKVASAQPKDRVIRQAPPGGRQARKGSTAVLTASKGRASPTSHRSGA
jgi:hypothetical protein